jgi:hypothetical protein
MENTLFSGRSLKIMAMISLQFYCISYSWAQTGDKLLFPVNDFTTVTKTIRTSQGEKKVSCRLYSHIPYVAIPVDRDFQSLDVMVPVAIDDKPVNSSDNPILFVIGVGGYMSVNNARSSTGGPGRGPENSGGLSSRQDLALAAGYTVVLPGCRGRDNKAPDGTFYGKAPAAIVDLKAAVRYIRLNKGLIPGNTGRIISVGCSAGGALSALLGASGNSPVYEKYLKEIGAADENDDIFASACFSPITDLEHADMAYEWNFGKIPARSGPVDQELSGQLRDLFSEYQSSLGLKGKNDFGMLTADNYDQYLLNYFLMPSAKKFLIDLPDEKRKEYLEKNKWIQWSGSDAEFSFNDYANHVGRMKGLPAFDDFEMRQPEPDLFGNNTTASRHFTNFSLRHATGNMNAETDPEVKELVNMMNAMYFIKNRNNGCAGYWRLRNGTSDNHTSQTVMVNLAVSLENLNKKVDASVFWDGGHCADNDPEGFIKWIGNISGL